MENKNYFMHKLNNLVVVKKIVTIHYQELSSKYSFNGENHDFWEMAYADKNQIIYTIGDENIVLNEGDIIFIKPNEFHSLRCENDANLFIMSFECNSNCMSYFNNKKVSLDSSSIKILSRLINEAKNTFNLPKFNPDLTRLDLLDNPLVGGEQMIKNYLEIFLIDLLRSEANKPSSSIVFLSKDKEELSFEEKIIHYLKNNLYNRICLDDICKETGYCKTYICTNFMRAMKYSIMEYYTILKIEEAKKLILNNTSFNNISSFLNFNSPSHFTNTFKKYTKMTPKQFKKSIVNSK